MHSEMTHASLRYAMRLALSCGFLRPAKTCRHTAWSQRYRVPAMQPQVAAIKLSVVRAHARTILVPGMYFFGFSRYSKRCSSPHTMPAATRHPASVQTSSRGADSGRHLAHLSSCWRRCRRSPRPDRRRGRKDR